MVKEETPQHECDECDEEVIAQFHYICHVGKCHEKQINICLGREIGIWFSAFEFHDLQYCIHYHDI